MNEFIVVLLSLTCADVYMIGIITDNYSLRGRGRQICHSKWLRNQAAGARSFQFTEPLWQNEPSAQFDAGLPGEAGGDEWRHCALNKTAFLSSSRSVLLLTWFSVLSPSLL